MLYLAALLFTQTSTGPVAKQGTLSFQQYSSPMIVEMRLPTAARKDWAPVEGRDRLTAFVCEGVWVDRVLVRARRYPADRRGKDLTGHIEANLTLANQKGTDRRVDVLGELVHRDVVLASATVKKIEVEEEKRSMRPIQWRMDADILPADLNDVTLRLTLTVVKD
jgi:hypothetical protein